jgi:small GTP-binding protein
LNHFDIVDSLLFDCQCALFLVDITDDMSLKKVNEIAEKIDFENNTILKVIFVENKIDLENERKIDEESINKFMDNYGIKEKVQISIKTGIGVENLVEKMNNLVNNSENNIPINYISLEKKETKENQFVPMLINLILLGNSNVGKTCFFNRFNKNQFQENFVSTIGIDKYIRYFKYKDKECKVCLWDTAGQDRYRSLPKKYYQNADGILILFDICNKESFNDVQIWMNEINDNANVNSEVKKISLFLIGNKIDLLERCINKDDGNDKASFYGMKYFEISCKLNINITEISARIIEECFTELEKQKGEQKVEKMNDSNNFKLNKGTKKKEKKKKKKFC